MRRNDTTNDEERSLTFLSFLYSLSIQTHHVLLHRYTTPHLHTGAQEIAYVTVAVYTHLLFLAFVGPVCLRGTGA